MFKILLVSFIIRFEMENHVKHIAQLYTAHFANAIGYCICMHTRNVHNVHRKQTRQLLTKEMD